MLALSKHWWPPELRRVHLLTSELRSFTRPRKHDSLGDVSKRDEGGEHGLEAAGLNARWDHAAWIKHC